MSLNKSLLKKLLLSVLTLNERSWDLGFSSNSHELIVQEVVYVKHDSDYWELFGTDCHHCHRRAQPLWGC